MEKEFLNILVFGHKHSKTKHLRIHKKTFKITLYLLGFAILVNTFFFCDYLQVKKKAFELDQLRNETQTQKSQIQFFSGRIEDLERQLSRLKDFDKKIRILANLEKGDQAAPLMGIGGPSPSDIRDKLKVEKDEKGLVHQMRVDVDRLKSEASSREESLSELEKLLQTKRDMLAHSPSVWPVLGWLTSGFGFRTNPFTGLSQMHEGLDISNKVGTLIVAPADGLVSDIGNDAAHGRVLVISHGFGMTSRYSHLNRVFVKAGQRVRRGDRIAEVGTSGKTTGPHLHYEVRVNGIPVNPMRYILN